MHNIFIPISVEPTQNRALTVERLRNMGAKRVFLSVGRLPFSKGEYMSKYLDIVKDAKDYYENAGFEVAFWTLTIGFGGGEDHHNREIAKDYTALRSIEGKDANGAFCPADKKFVDALLIGIKELCKLKPKIIMLDDELCMSVRPGIGCACDRHLKMLSDELGESITLNDIKTKVFCGKSNRYRKAWFKVMGNTLRDFCREIRKTVDSVDSSIRMGFCAGYTSWDFEGVSAAEITKILAGNTQPFLRYTGAPYWVEASRFKRITQASIIESVRMQRPWCDGIEVFAEGDSYTRQRFITSSAQCEVFDLALRGFLGYDSLKYPFDYGIQPDYDSGYYNAHMKNTPLFNALKNVGGDEYGIRVYEYSSKIEKADLPSEFLGEKPLMEGFYFPHASKLFSSIGLPTVYEGKGVCGALFGENARYIGKDELDGGFILDLDAARILKERGVDVGLESFKPIDKAVCEYYGEDKSTLTLYPSGPIYDLTLSDGALPQGYFKSIDIIEDYSYPSCYYYQNRDGQRFFVYAWSGREQRNDSVLFQSYYRSEQLQKAIFLLTDDRLPVVCDTHPHLYTLCKRDKNKVHMLCCNIHPDQIDVLHLKTVKSIKNINIIGADSVEKSDLHADVFGIKPYGCVLFSIEF